MSPNALPHGTPFLSTLDVAHIVQRDGLGATYARLVERLRRDFLRWSEFDKSARVAHHSKAGVIELMPISDHARYAFKYVNGHPGNTAWGLPTVMAFGGLAKVATGEPELISELTLCTALRTAATSVLAAQVLARPDSRVMALIGNGAQSEFQALAFAHLMGIHVFQLYDVDVGATHKLAGHLQDLGLSVRCCRDAQDAADGADIVTTATADKSHAAIVTARMLRPGMHLNCIGGDCPGKTEVPPEVLQHARVVVEFEPQSRHEGDVQQMPASFPVTELWTVLAGHQPGRTHVDEITLFDSVGFALEDFSVLSHMLEASQRLGMGQTLDLIPSQANPKDLFRLIGTASSPAPTLDGIDSVNATTTPH